MQGDAQFSEAMQVSSGYPPNRAPRDTPVYRELEEIGSQVGSLSEELEQLAGRISPVLEPELPRPDAERELLSKIESGADLMLELAALNRRISTIRQRLAELTGRVQV
jgi:hypothetical protein